MVDVGNKWVDNEKQIMLSKCNMAVFNGACKGACNLKLEIE